MKVDLYEKRISTKRRRDSTYGARTPVVSTESDRGRIIFSNAFRRLQQKAQVFSLESNAAVRTRLTHSLEVAHTGRYLAEQVLMRLRESFKDYKSSWLSNHEQAFINIVESACLLHDIGNPPFGHFGEAAIRDWFRRNQKKYEKCLEQDVDEPARREYFDERYEDFRQFDGNPQGLRLITKLQGDDGRTGLNVTYGLLGAYMKYACAPCDTKKCREGGRYKKPGYFVTESDVVDEIRTNVGICGEDRHPLSYLMEAADDIAYCLSDIEDGIEKRILTERDFFETLESEWKRRVKELGMSREEGAFREELLEKWRVDGPIGKYTVFKTSLINHLVEVAADFYVRNHDICMQGKIDGLVDKESKEGVMLDVVRHVVSCTVFRSEEAEGVELAGYGTITGLLNRFSRLLECDRRQFEGLIENDREVISEYNIDYEKRLINKVSGKAIKAYMEFTNEATDACEEWHLRTHMIVDYVSGMTDDYALQTYQLLEGIEVDG